MGYLGLASEPAEEDHLAPDVPVEVHEAGADVPQLDRLSLEGTDRFFETLGQVRPLRVELGLPVVVRVVRRVDLFAPELLKASEFGMDLPQPNRPGPEPGEKLFELGYPCIRFLDGP